MIEGMPERQSVPKRITLVRAACGRSGFISLKEDYANSLGSDLSHVDPKGVKTRIYSLKEVADEFKIENALLKINCEGGEYDIILGADSETLRRFEQIQVMYHYGYVNLVKKLRDAGFRTRYTLPHVNMNDEAKEEKTLVGYIYAERE